MLETIIGLFNYILPDILYLVALAVIFYGRKIWTEWKPKIESWLESHTTATQRKMISDLGSEAFAYAETVYRNKNGSDKLHEALSYFQSHMSRCGLSNLTYDTIRASIEKAWLQDKSTRNSEIKDTVPPEHPLTQVVGTESQIS